MFRMLLVGLFLIGTGTVVLAQPPGEKLPPPRINPMPPPPAPMGWTVVYPAPAVVVLGVPAYGYIPPRLGYDAVGRPLGYPYTSYMPGYPYPGYTMLYPYPRTVSSYSSGPSAYPMMGPVGGYWWW